MKLGGFGRIADYDSIKSSGFDYAELDIPEITDLAETEFEAFCDKVHSDGFPVLTGARALPIAEPWFFTEQFSLDTYRDFIMRACTRAKRLGIRKIILGNGKARMRPGDNSAALEHNFTGLLRLYAEAADAQGIEVILEPLGPDYSNYINTLPEAFQVVRKTQMPNLFIMADLRHMYRSGETYEDIVEYVDMIHHIHIDYPDMFPERPFPRKTDGFDYSPFLSALKRSGYSGTLTMEADIPDDWTSAYRNAVEVLEDIL